MMNFWKCFLYCFVLGTVSFFVGQLLPRRCFHAEHAPWRSVAWERNGRVYDKLRIRRWMNAVPDMSRMVSGMVPKRIDGVATAASVDTLIKETCVAELTHSALAVAGFACVFIWEGSGGWIVSAVFAVGNLPYIFIQRYNRPRLLRLHAWLVAREQKAGVQGDQDITKEAIEA